MWGGGNRHDMSEDGKPADDICADEKKYGFLINGNRWWERKVREAGRPPLYTDPWDLWTDCCSYFEWLEENPLMEDKTFAYEGAVSHEPVARARVATLGGLCLHLGTSPQIWGKWRRERDDLKPVIGLVEEAIRTQKFELAAANLANAGLIARDLGLAERQEVTSPDGSMTPSVTVYQLPDNGRG
jgi:hypothetical protein